MLTRCRNTNNESKNVAMDKPRSRVALARHLEDINDLAGFGRDADLIPGQEKEARAIAEELLNEARSENKEALLFVCSDKRRGIQTAEMIVEQLKQIDTIKTKIVQEPRLAGMHQGVFILPPGYKAGETFSGLRIAEKIYNREAFELDPPNDLYRFGDPVAEPNGTYKYPELVPYFSSYGENNREVMTRLYEMIIQIYEKRAKLDRRTKVVAITHAQLYSIIKNLIVVTQKVKDGEVTVRPGELPRLCWYVFKERQQRGEQPSYGTNYVSIDDVCDEQSIQLLREELKYLQNLA